VSICSSFNSNRARYLCWAATIHDWVIADKIPCHTKSIMKTALGLLDHHLVSCKPAVGCHKLKVKYSQDRWSLNELFSIWS
jgi:hypothetical protein